MPPVNFKQSDRKMQKAAGTCFLRLNGCVRCNQHVFKGKADKRKQCPRCGCERYNSKGQPFEEVFYFPLKPKLASLLRLPAYQAMCQHEFERQKLKKDDNLVTDVYDSAAWQAFMGPPVSPINRIGIYVCCACIYFMFVLAINNCMQHIQVCKDVWTAYQLFLAKRNH